MKIALLLNYNSAFASISVANTALQVGVDAVVIVDNASTDDSWKHLQMYSESHKMVRVARSPENAGYASGNNFGLTFIESEFGVSEDNVIYVINPDVLVNKQLVTKLADYLLDHSEVALVSGLMSGSGHSGWKRLSIRRAFLFSSHITRAIMFYLLHETESKYYPMLSHQKKPYQVDVIIGAFFAVRQSVFKQLDYFDEGTFLYYEEEILSAKVLKMGKKNMILPEVSFDHAGGGSSAGNYYFYKREADKSRLYFLKKYEGLPRLGEIILKFIYWVDDSFWYNKK